MMGRFGLHDPKVFRIFCYSSGADDGSHYRQRILRDSDQFVDLHTVSPADAVRRIFEDQVDILVDLNGYTEGSRMDTCALRPAPIQISYLGFPGTTGAGFFHYIITDRIVTAGIMLCFTASVLFICPIVTWSPITDRVSPRCLRKGRI